MIALPKRFWVAADMSNLLTAFNLRTNGALFSVAANEACEDEAILTKYLDGSLEYTPWIPNPHADLGKYPSPFQLTVTRHLRVELLLEHARRLVNPLLPSRFSAVFAVGTKKDAIAIARQSHRLLDEVYAFELEPSPLNRVAKANFEIVGLLRGVLDQATWNPDHLAEYARAYWLGVGTLSVDIPSTVSPTGRKQPTCGVRWEYLIEGRLNRIGGGLGWPGPGSVR